MRLRVESHIHDPGLTEERISERIREIRQAMPVQNVDSWATACEDAARELGTYVRFTADRSPRGEFELIAIFF